MVSEQVMRKTAAYLRRQLAHAAEETVRHHANSQTKDATAMYVGMLRGGGDFLGFLAYCLYDHLGRTPGCTEEDFKKYCVDEALRLAVVEARETFEKLKSRPPEAKNPLDSTEVAHD